MSNAFYVPGEQRAAKVNDLFARIARRYDLINDLQSFGLHRLWKRRVVQLAKIKTGDRALDVIEIRSVPEIAPFLRALASAGFDVVGAATRGGAASVPGGGSAGPWALVLGNEEHGLAPDVQAACTRLATIPGGGRVESLNVSAAAAILIHELGKRAVARQPGVS